VYGCMPPPGFGNKNEVCPDGMIGILTIEIFASVQRIIYLISG
jgi:hypothetical protein